MLVRILAATAVALIVAAPASAETIGQIQGPVTDTDNGHTHRSPFAPASGNGSGTTTVTVRGVITQKLATCCSGSNLNRSFTLEDPQGDGDPRTSDGIAVFHGRFSTLLREGGGTYTPQIGDLVELRGRVSEFFNLTQLNNPRLVEVVATGQTLPAPFAADPPHDAAEAARYWERREGMRAAIPAGALAISGRDVFSSSFDAETWVMRGDHPVAARDDVFARRAFRDAHPLDDLAGRFDNGNGWRILLGSHGLKGDGDREAMLPATRTFDRFGDPIVGAVSYGFGKYGVHPAVAPAAAAGADPSGNAVPPEPVRRHEYSVANYNVENLYDFRDDPSDGCDFAGNPGCPGVRPPFNYVPESAEEYESKLAEQAAQIIGDLHAPDIVLIQEAEDQDLDEDGRPDPLEDLAAAIRAAGGPRYQAAADRDGADDRGIISAFLYRTDRVQRVRASAEDPVLGADPRIEYRGEPLEANAEVSNPKALNADLPDDVDRSTGTDGPLVFTRAPQVAHFRVWRDRVGRGQRLDVYAVSNHFSSGPDRRVGQRTEQARYNAAIADALEGERVLVGGDLNVFPRPDGNPPGDDQLGPLYDQAALRNLYDVLIEEVPASAYTYVFQGQAQTLDHQFVSGRLWRELRGVRVAHINADWPADHGTDGPRGASDHDPVVSRFGFSRGTTPP